MQSGQVLFIGKVWLLISFALNYLLANARNDVNHMANKCCFLNLNSLN